MAAAIFQPHTLRLYDMLAQPGQRPYLPTLSYAKPGTNLAYGSMPTHYANTGTDLSYGSTQTHYVYGALWIYYGMSGTDLGYDPTRPIALPASVPALPARVPQYQVSSAIGLCACYAMSGTDIGYASDLSPTTRGVKPPYAPLSSYALTRTQRAYLPTRVLRDIRY
eukprot:452198-Rhodomonas_salina.4